MSVSARLSWLHRRGLIARLAHDHSRIPAGGTRRQSVYVLPEHAGDRQTTAQGKQPRRTAPPKRRQTTALETIGAADAQTPPGAADPTEVVPALLRLVGPENTAALIISGRRECPSLRA